MITIMYKGQTVDLEINPHKRKGRGIVGVTHSMTKELKKRCDITRWSNEDKEQVFHDIYNKLLETIE